jgi:RNA polymerase sigma-70 factor (ECF subfamily)
MASSLTWTFPERPPPSGRAHAISAALAPADAWSVADPSLAALDERELVDACLAGRTAAFDLIVERHRRGVYQLCYRFVGNHEDASDLSQEIFLRAYRGLRTFRGQASLSTWLYRIGVNVCLNRVSAKTPSTEPIDAREHEDTHAESASERLLRAERAANVRAAIAQLPRKQRATLILRVYREMSHQEIADILGSSVGAVKANFFHALGNLKKLLRDAGDED